MVKLKIYAQPFWPVCDIKPFKISHFMTKSQSLSQNLTVYRKIHTFSQMDEVKFLRTFPSLTIQTRMKTSQNFVARN